MCSFASEQFDMLLAVEPMFFYGNIRHMYKLTLLKGNKIYIHDECICAVTKTVLEVNVEPFI